MAGLKELRTRIEAIKSTKKITSAMKMVAAAGLRRAQGLIARSEAYGSSLRNAALRAACDLRQECEGGEFSYPPLLAGYGRDQSYLLIVISSDKGLCGSYNAHVSRAALNRIKELEEAGKDVKVVCIGKKAADVIKRRHAGKIVSVIDGIARKGADFDETTALAQDFLLRFEKREFDVAEIVSSHFVSALSRKIASRRFLPAGLSLDETVGNNDVNRVNDAFYDYEPDKTALLESLLLMLVKAQMFDAVVQAQASEQGARMASMDNATRNATDMISKLTLRYNGIRQSAITTELTEIISGAEAI